MTIDIVHFQMYSVCAPTYIALRHIIFLTRSSLTHSFINPFLPLINGAPTMCWAARCQGKQLEQWIKLKGNNQVFIHLLWQCSQEAKSGSSHFSSQNDTRWRANGCNTGRGIVSLTRNWNKTPTFLWTWGLGRREEGEGLGMEVTESELADLPCSPPQTSSL